MQFAAQAQRRVPSDDRSSEEIELDFRVDAIWRSLEQAARGDHIAWALSNAMASVDAHYQNRQLIISADQRVQLMSAVIRTHAIAAVYLPKSYNRNQIDAGMEAFATQIMLWAEAPDRTVRRHPHFLSDTRAHARMFRNDLHNMSLLDEIEARSNERFNRRAKVIRDLMADGGPSVDKDS
jgi:riboflavin biosynthesis pyrimidine reductase